MLVDDLPVAHQKRTCTMTNTPSADAAALADRLCIRETLERYFHGLDSRDEDELAACFADDAVATHHKGSDTEFTLSGGREIARYFCTLMRKYAASHHTASNAVIRVAGDTASADTFATVHIVSGEQMRVRGIRYLDDLVRKDGGWRIRGRTHIPLWQFEVPAVKPFLPR